MWQKVAESGSFRQLVNITLTNYLSTFYAVTLHAKLPLLLKTATFGNHNLNKLMDQKEYRGSYDSGNTTLLLTSPYPHLIPSGIIGHDHFT